MKLRTTILTAITATAALLLATVSHAQTPPTVLNASAEFDQGGAGGSEPTNYYVDVLFSQAMDTNSVLNAANYSISGATITGVSLFTDNWTNIHSSMVILQLAAPLTGPFTLNVSNNVMNASEVPIANNTSVNGTVDPLQSVDIGAGGAITVPGTTFCTGPGSYVINASGDDIYGTQDSFRYIYLTRTNNFDIVVRVTSLLGADQWTKAGLQAREVIDPDDGGSRMITIACTPAATNVTLDGSAPINDITGDWRNAPDFPAYNNNTYAWDWYAGEFSIAPTYTNQWFRLTRQLTATNDLYTGYTSSDKTNWIPFEYWDAANDNLNGDGTPFPSVVNVGIALTGHNGGSSYLATATLGGFSDYVPVPPSSPPPPAIPGVLNAVAFTDDGGAAGAEPTNYYVDVLFNENMDANSALTPTNYSISGATITGATFFTNTAGIGLSNMVILQLTAPLNTAFTLHINTNVVNPLGNAVSNLTVSGTVSLFQSVDIGGAGAITVPGTTFCSGSNSFAVDASGYDIYGNQDSFRYIYETRTNNFDIVTRVTSLLPADQWTKAGLMVREMIDPNDGGSRMMFLGCTPNKFFIPADKSGGDINDITGDWRDATDAAARNAAYADASSFYTGDGVIHPNFPNQWLRLTRKVTATSDLYTGYSSPDGTNWTPFEYWNAADADAANATPFPSVVNIGIAVCGHAGGTPYVATATLDSFSDYVAPANAVIPIPGGAIRNDYNLGGTNDLIVLEAVDYNTNVPSQDATHNWVFTSTPINLSPTDLDKNFSAAGVMEAQPNTGVNMGSASTAGPELSYAVNFSAAGTYYLWMRGIADSPPGPSVNDSVLVGLDGAITTAIGNSGWAQGNGFYWDGAANVLAGSDAIVITSAGVHVINVWMREDGFDFDKLVLTTNANYTPADVGPAESPVLLPRNAYNRNEYNLGGTNNLIVLEAVDYNTASPSADTTHNWVFTTTPINLGPTDLDTNFSAAGVMEAQPNVGVNMGSASTAGPELSYTVTFSSAGTYYLWMRGIADSPPGASVNDSVLVGLDGAIVAAIGNSGWTITNGFYWDGAANVLAGSAAINIAAAGTHVINVWMREDGFDFDKLVLTANSSYTPTDVGPAESPLALPTVGISASSGNITITWLPGTTLQSATNILGPWADVGGATSPYTVVPTGTQRFYRMRE